MNTLQMIKKDYLKVSDLEKVQENGDDMSEVESIHESMGQKFYKLENRPKQLMRSEILLIN